MLSTRAPTFPSTFHTPRPHLHHYDSDKSLTVTVNTLCAVFSVVAELNASRQQVKDWHSVASCSNFASGASPLEPSSSPYPALSFRPFVFHALFTAR